jgi:hypothetical protein
LIIIFQILNRLDKLSDEIAIIKQLQQSSLSSSSNLQLESTSSTSSSLTANALKANEEERIYQWLFQRLELAFDSFLAGIDDTVSIPSVSTLITTLETNNYQHQKQSQSPLEKLKLACDILLMFIKNLLNNPETSRYRKILITNTNFKTLLSNIPGHKRILLALGFQWKITCWEWEWSSVIDNPPPPAVATMNNQEQQQHQHHHHMVENEHSEGEGIVVYVPSHRAMIQQLLQHAMTRIQAIKAGDYQSILIPATTTTTTPLDALSVETEEGSLVGASNPSTSSQPAESVESIESTTVDISTSSTVLDCNNNSNDGNSNTDQRQIEENDNKSDDKLVDNIINSNYSVSTSMLSTSISTLKFDEVKTCYLLFEHFISSSYNHFY